MGHTSELKLWLLENIGRFDIRIEHLTWLQRFIPGFTDVSVALTYDGRQFSGWGFAENEDLAFTKALAEAFERLALWYCPFQTSNGFAVHRSFEEAKQNAINELRERDLFLCHFLTGTPLPRCNERFLEEIGLGSIKKWFDVHGVKLSLFRLGKSGFASVLDGRNAQIPFGFIFGAAINSDQRLAACSAVVEACRDGFRIVQERARGIVEAISLESFLARVGPGFREHGDLALNLEYAERIRWFIEDDRDCDRELGGVDDCSELEISVVEVKPQIVEMAEVPLVFVRASSPHLQDMFLGTPRVEDINLERLRGFSGRPVTWLELNHLPHPFA